VGEGFAGAGAVRKGTPASRHREDLER